MPHQETIRHCRACGGGLEEREISEKERRPVCIDCGTITYVDPKLAAAMIVEDGTVTHLNVEEGAGVDVSSAETMMALL